MKRYLLFILLLISFGTFAQNTIKISELPAYSANPSGGILPLVIGGSTKKFDAVNFVWTGGAYANPSWITSLPYSKLTGRPTALSSFTNDLGNYGGFLTSYTETDPTISSWAKAGTKPSYSWSEISSKPTALSSFTNDLGNYGAFLTSYTETDPTISSWAKASTKPSYAWSEITSKPTALSSFTNDLGNYGSFLTSESDPSVYAWAKASSKPSYAWSEITSKPTALSSFTNDLGNYGSFLTSESDPSVYTWAKASTKPSYAWSEITSKPTALSSFTNDLGNYGGFLTSYTETDPTISSWAKAGTKPSYEWSEITSKPTALSSFTNDLGNYGSFLTSESDPSVYAWAKASSKPSYAWSEITSKPTALSSFTNDLGNYGGWITGVSWAAITGTVPTWNQNTTGTSRNITDYTINQNLGTGNSPTFYDITASNNFNGKNLVLNTGSGSVVPAVSGNGGLRLKDSNTSNEVSLGLPSSTELNIGASITAKHYSSNSFVSIAAGAGAGTSPTVTIAGNDVGMKITVVVGSSPAASDIIATITFGTAYQTPPSLVFSPGNGNAAALNGARSIYIDNNDSTTSFTLVAGTTPITTTLTYIWYVNAINANSAF